MADVIRHKRSATAAAVPSAGQLALGELAINVADGRLYFKTSAGDIVAVANLTDAWALQPIGVPFPIQTHITGVPVPPTDNPNYRYIKLTASDSYNDGVLTSESVSGSAPEVQATAVIDDAGSPMYGETVRLINTERRFLRPGSSGAVEADAFQGHTFAGDANIRARDVGYSIVGLGGTRLPALTAANSGNDLHVISDGANGSPRTANETRVKSLGADYFMRIR
ncbi:hypothetical protein H3221_025395 [Pseudomonas sp. LMG 31766]|uniref:Uncharacterized protein n=1 Tax=Pseudomonas chaetocerotis TaxID=2758695 RepID=A0A931D999_9PSED|nr:hypothetical protein [Pseudomonas chaetocerotis]MBZ9668075.1 hypothetical protein [Pseudomonas chaetocerotis]